MIHGTSLAEQGAVQLGAILWCCHTLEYVSLSLQVLGSQQNAQSWWIAVQEKAEGRRMKCRLGGSGREMLAGPKFGNYLCLDKNHHSVLKVWFQ